MKIHDIVPNVLVLTKELKHNPHAMAKTPGIRNNIRAPWPLNTAQIWMRISATATRSPRSMAVAK